jgi:hypothetical protein
MRVMNIPDGGQQNNVNDDVVVADVPINERVENGRTYTIHVFGGCQSSGSL